MTVVDLDEALERFEGDSALWAEFADTWLETAQADRDAFINALTLGDSNGALYCIHKLKGAAATIGAVHLANLGQDIEVNLRAHLLEEAKSLSPRFERSYEATIAETKILIDRFRTRG